MRNEGKRTEEKERKKEVSVWINEEDEGKHKRLHDKKKKKIKVCKRRGLSQS